jgi:glycosyltransferase involved in cell wall biosynthesis
MKIGFDAKRAFYNNSGLGNYSRNVINMLAENYPNEEYFLYSPSVPEDLPDFATNKTVVTSGSRNKIKSSIWRSYTSGFRIKKDNIDIYHGLSNEIPLHLHTKHIRSVVTIHDLIFLRFPELFKSADVSIYTHKFKNACKKADRIIAVSKQTKEDIIRFFNIPPAKINVIYQDCNTIFQKTHNPIELKNIQEKYGLPEDYLLSVGTIEQRKNAMLILKAMVLYDIQTPLVLIGKPTSYINHLLAYAQKYGIKDKIIMRFKVVDEDLPAIYQNASIFLYPSLFEGFGIPVLEALNSGLPVITSNASSLPEVAGTGSLLIDPGSHEHLGKVLYDLLQNPELQNRMIQDGYKHALNFRGNVLAPQIMNLYQFILQQ